MNGSVKHEWVGTFRWVLWHLPNWLGEQSSIIWKEVIKLQNLVGVTQVSSVFHAEAEPRYCRCRAPILTRQSPDTAEAEPRYCRCRARYWWGRAPILPRQSRDTADAEPRYCWSRAPILLRQSLDNAEAEPICCWGRAPILLRQSPNTAEAEPRYCWCWARILLRQSPDNAEAELNSSGRYEWNELYRFTIQPVSINYKYSAWSIIGARKGIRPMEINKTAI